MRSTPAPAAVAHDTADRLFAEHAAVFGRELPVYRNHVHRVLGLVAGQVRIPDDRAAALGLAAFFHDAGLWFDGTWDYLPPSVDRAVAALDDPRHARFVTDVIAEHHRLGRAHGGDPVVEAFRRADLTDLTGGLVGAPGVPGYAYRVLVAGYPATGFRPMLLRAFGRGLREHPLRPAPMLKR